MASRDSPRVDTVTGLRWLAVEVYGHVIALSARLLFGVIRATARFEHVGAVPAPGTTPPITCAWHEHLPAVFLVAFPARVPTIWMNHPAWVMRPIHLLLGWYGVGSLALGSSGHGGRGALDAVIDAVRGGDVTFLNPDGPHGPAHVVKDGVLDLAIRTGLPVKALSFRYRRAVRAPTWDRKWFPLPGSVVEVCWSEPVTVTAANREDARARLSVALDGASPTPST